MCKPHRATHDAAAQCRAWTYSPHVGRGYRTSPCGAGRPPSDFHGLHPGIPLIHGHKTFHVDIAYGGIPGNILFVGRTLDGVNTLGDMLQRLQDFMGLNEEQKC